MIHGNDAVIETAGVFSVLEAKTIEPSSKLSLVASSNSYSAALRTGVHANDGVRENVCAAASSTRTRNGFKPVGAAGGRPKRGSACAEAARTRTVEQAAAKRRTDIATGCVGSYGGPAVPRSRDSSCSSAAAAAS